MHVHPGRSSTTRDEENSLYTFDPEEQAFQEYVDGLFNSSTFENTIDTSGWCTTRINCSRFDHRYMPDTLRIPLIDASNDHNFTYPFKNYVTSPFGQRRNYWHFGTDIKVNYRDTIRCALDGIVRIVTNDRYGYGKVVVVRHHYGLETLYGHMSKTCAKNNQEIKSGDVIGLGGRTGRATGHHLHFEIRFCGEPFDPAEVLNYENYTLQSDTLILTRNTFSYLTGLRETVFHTIRKGDYLGKIARKYGTSIRSLCALNGISRKSILRIGNRILVRKKKEPELILNNIKVTGNGG